jgi:hypothetical protein
MIVATHRPDAVARARRAARPLFAAVLALHGIVHWIGFAVPFGLMTSTSNPYTTTALWGNLELGDAGAHVVGIAYLALILPFVAAGYGILRERRWAIPLTAVVAGLSAVVCALTSPNAVVGLVLNLVIVGFVLVAPQLVSAQARPAWSRQPREVA